MSITSLVTWKLVLTQIMMFGQWSSFAPTLTTTVVDGFTTEQACRQAGAQVETDARTMASTKQFTLSTTFSCIKDK